MTTGVKLQTSTNAEKFKTGWRNEIIVSFFFLSLLPVLPSGFQKIKIKNTHVVKGRKLRQRLEQLERQAGENGATGATTELANNPKRRRPQSSIEASGTSGKAGETPTERNTTKKVSNLEDRSSIRSPTLLSVEIGRAHV